MLIYIIITIQPYYKECMHSLMFLIPFIIKLSSLFMVRTFLFYLFLQDRKEEGNSIFFLDRELKN